MVDKVNSKDTKSRVPSGKGKEVVDSDIMTELSEIQTEMAVIPKTASKKFTCATKRVDDMIKNWDTSKKAMRSLLKDVMALFSQANLDAIPQTQKYASDWLKGPEGLPFAKKVKKLQYDLAKAIKKHVKPFDIVVEKQVDSDASEEIEAIERLRARISEANKLGDKALVKKLSKALVDGNYDIE
jgi:anti-sigma28 factor (negative regulator of flagellin synthesis)